MPWDGPVDATLKHHGRKGRQSHNVRGCQRGCPHRYLHYGWICEGQREKQRREEPGDKRLTHICILHVNCLLNTDRKSVLLRRGHLPSVAREQDSMGSCLNLQDARSATVDSNTPNLIDSKGTHKTLSLLRAGATTTRMCFAVAGPSYTLCSTSELCV